MATFELISSLPVKTREELTRIQALSSGHRTTQEAAFLTALDPYIDNQVLRYDGSNDATEVELTDLIIEAEGNTVPQSYEGFKQGALFRDLDKAGMNIYINVGD